MSRVLKFALLALWALVAIVPMAAAAEPVVEFDIPAQSLDAALEAFGTATGSIAVYNGNLTVGLQSSALKGRLTPAKALESLLGNTGLVGEYTSQNAFVVVPGDRSSATVAMASAIAQAALSRQSDDERRYSGLLQENVIRSLCLQPETQAGGYRAVISFWINAAGEAVHPKLLSSTGDQRRDAAIPVVVAHVSIGEPPPARMAQPFTMIVLPQTPRSVALCPPTEARGRRDD